MLSLLYPLYSFGWALLAIFVYFMCICVRNVGISICIRIYISYSNKKICTYISYG